MSIGYACIAIGVKDTRFSRCSLKNATEDNIRRITKSNLEALSKVIDYNTLNNIKLFRISSDIIPFGSHYINSLNWHIEFEELFKSLGNKILAAEIRVSMHPGQYTVLNSKESRVLENAILDLEYHAKFLDLLKVDKKNKIIIHIGGVYGDKEKSSMDFIRNYSMLSNNVKNRIVIENDDKSYNIEDVILISKETKIPVVFDNLHHKLNPPTIKESNSYWIEECRKTWQECDGPQKIHYSQQKIGASKGSHSETIFIDEFVKFYAENKISDNQCDIMLEVKDKNLSALKIINTCVRDSKAKTLESEWAKYKYFVLSKSAPIYNEIRDLLKDKNSRVAEKFYNKIEEAMLLLEDKGQQINAAQHIWGYFKNDCTKAEKKRYEKLLTEYNNNQITSKIIKNHLLRCSERLENQYLIESLYFYI